MKETLTCFIIEDEPLAQEMLENYISKVSFLELKGVFMNAMEAVKPIKSEKPDILFLDINMPYMDGMSFIPMLNPKPSIILTVNMLLKPLSWK
ncbi:LytR/AlgR family response regulator transcription factor [Litoribacter populi]|uniref:LytR/AlgR family response regulator transcription factor n=1 Tax=Litoribacter populi TaxID=2598460 RepID=UPI001F3FD0E3|nr:response regulator [Litoribacter populi]